MTARKHPLEVGAWARTMEGDLCRIIAERVLIDGKTREFTVRYREGPEKLMLEGFLEASTEWAP